MVTEAALAGLVIFIAAAALIWDPSGGENPFGFQYFMISLGDPIRAFATGYGRLVSSLPALTLVIGTFFGMVMLNAFVLTTLDTGTRLGRFITTELLGKKVNTFLTFIKNCDPISIVGYPAITVPAGYGNTGLPIGLQIVAQPWEEAKLLSMAYAFEQETKVRKPPKL